MDYNFITERVATGAALSGQSDVDVLVSAGVTAVVDARIEFDDAPLFTNDPNLLYLWNPTADDGQPKLTEYWAKTLNFALPILAQPKTKVYLHCAAGVNRGPSNAVCVLMALGWTYNAAMALLKAARPQAVAQYAEMLLLR